VQFEGTRFYGPAAFDKATFSKAGEGDSETDEVSFWDCRFKKHANFSAIKSWPPLNFLGASFGGPVDFRGASFEEAPHFLQARFSGFVRFGRRAGTRFQADVPLEGEPRGALSPSLAGARLYGAAISETSIEGWNMSGCFVDAETAFMDCTADENTDTRTLPLDIVRMDPGLNVFLKYANRRLAWQDWYRENMHLKYPVALFWLLSDYGRSTKRIIWWFTGLSLTFAFVYYLVGLPFSLLGKPGIVDSLFAVDGVVLPWWLVPFRAIYFSVVTMTTLGFGDMHTEATSLCGHILLTVQVILGYVMLGALVTRLGILFTGTGPCANMPVKVSDWTYFRDMLKDDMKKAFRRKGKGRND